MVFEEVFGHPVRCLLRPAVVFVYVGASDQNTTGYHILTLYCSDMIQRSVHFEVFKAFFLICKNIVVKMPFDAVSRL